MSINSKGSHYPKNVILYAVFFYVRYAVSYRDLEEIMAEGGVQVDHATLNRWVVKCRILPKRHKTGSKRQQEAVWTKHTSRSKGNGCICIGPLINTSLVHCCAMALPSSGENA